MTLKFCSQWFAITVLLVAGCAGTDSSQSGESYCVMSLPSQQTSCFDSFTEAISAATGGKITDAPADPHVAMTDEVFKGRINALASEAPARSNITPGDPTPFVLGIQYLNYNLITIFRLAALVNWGTPCDGDTSTPDWDLASLSTDWNDKISSFQAFSNCWEQLYQDVNFQGAQTSVLPLSTNVGSTMNDQASSLRFF